MANHPPSISTHPLAGPSGNTIIKKALSLLRPHLPDSLPLYRRLQFGRFFPDTTLVTNIPSLDRFSESSAPPAPGSNAVPDKWIIAFVDRTCRPETEVWWFGSWEVETTATAEDEEAVGAILSSVCRAIAALRVPESMHQDILDAAAEGRGKGSAEDAVKDHSGVSRADYSAHLSDAKIVLCGGIHERSLPGLKRTGTIKQLFQGSEGTQLVPCHTFIFDLDRGELPGEGAELPIGLRWGNLRHEHFAIVRARTQIPRQDRTLAVLPSLAIYQGEVPVAWAFIGLDGSLTSLHVEEELRGKGLAKAITIKLFREKMDFLWEKESPRLAHGYVIEGNQQSVHLCESIGGVRQWNAFWVRVDLGALQ